MLEDETLVEVHYVGTLDDGTEFDSSRGKRARVFVLGRGQMAPSFEAEVRSMALGERRKVRFPEGTMYGPHLPELVYSVPRADVPPGVRLGDEVQLSGGRPARVVAESADGVTVDANHPLAGQALNFEIELVAARAT